MWKKRKPPRRLTVRLVKCSECGRLVKAGNFCCQCGHKIRLYCNCWILKRKYDCGRIECPGIHIYTEIIKSLQMHKNEERLYNILFEKINK